MITDTDITRLKETFATKSEMNKRFDAVDKRFDAVDERFEDMDEKIDSIAFAVGQIQNTLDGIAGAIHDQQVENGAGAVHLARHDRHIAALALATNVALPD